MKAVGTFLVFRRVQSPLFKALGISTHVTVFWNVTACRFVHRCQYFRKKFCVQSYGRKCVSQITVQNLGIRSRENIEVILIWTLYCYNDRFCFAYLYHQLQMLSFFFSTVIIFYFHLLFIPTETTHFALWSFPIQLRNNSMEQSPSWQANRSSASQEIPHRKIHYSIHNSPPPVPIQTRSIHSITFIPRLKDTF